MTDPLHRILGDDKPRGDGMMAAGIYETLKAQLEKRGVQVSGGLGQNRCIYFPDPDGDDPDGHWLQRIVCT